MRKCRFVFDLEIRKSQRVAACPPDRRGAVRLGCKQEALISTGTQDLPDMKLD